MINLNPMENQSWPVKPLTMPPTFRKWPCVGGWVGVGGWVAGWLGGWVGGNVPPLAMQSLRPDRPQPPTPPSGGAWPLRGIARRRQLEPAAQRCNGQIKVTLGN